MLLPTLTYRKSYRPRQKDMSYLELITLYRVPRPAKKNYQGYVSRNELPEERCEPWAKPSFFHPRGSDHGIARSLH